jgi:Phosphotransferase enzyme family
MSEVSQEWQSNVYTIIFYAAESRILMMPGTTGWSLPSFQFSERLRFGNVAPVVHELRRTLNLEVTVLRWADVHYSHEETHAQVDITVTAESTSTAWVMPGGTQWMGREALHGLQLALPQQREVIEICLSEKETRSVPALRAAWERSGWFAHATSWIRGQLAQLDYTMVAPVEQIRIWGISCILRALTTVGAVYFKVSPFPAVDDHRALPFLFANEAALTGALAVLYPEHIPLPLAVDPTLGWMLLEDFGQPLREYPVIAMWEDALQTFSRMQVDSTRQVETLLASGCLDRRLDKLSGQIDSLLNDMQALVSLDKTEVEQLRAYAPLLKAMCKQLASYNVPPALVHGDLHPGNVALHQGSPTFFDWTDGSVSHPFFDAITFWGEVDVMEDEPVARARLRDVYLAQWMDFEPMERLLEATALAEVLGALHQIVSYQHILANMEPPWRSGVGVGVAFWVRTLLKAMKQYRS